MECRWLPTIEVESAHGVREVTLNSRHLMNRRIFLTGEIDAAYANSIVSQLLFLEEDSDKPVDLYINSPGGEVNAGLLIYDALQASKLKINIICMGYAASMAAIILAGGQKGRRYIMEHSKVMIHEPLIANGMGGSASSVKNISDAILETRDMINQILADHTGKTLEEVNEATRYDNYMNAEEAISFGICDKVIKSLRVNKNDKFV